MFASNSRLMRLFQAALDTCLNSSLLCQPLSFTVCTSWLGRPQSADKKFVRARGPQNRNPEVFNQTGCSRILHVEFALNNRELVKAEVFEKRVFEQTTPLNKENEGGIFL